ncbi:hypothetical protein F3Y22_tig00110865pilonHSYRG00123 [Hibiscus syriacus]|uniref:Uncharacterized protein n=1 Tax=Hibiscus syriacus TaxID=106335 RepID=A0A6A2ZL26_HIBSY|nr:hypothetical protein F3Y22_tig00110865pilonHSYRG00123 [Hibiscus syriacus]
MIGEVKNHGECEKIEQFEMASEFGKRLETMDKTFGFSEVVIEAKKTERLDKWSLMGRLGNKARSFITQFENEDGNVEIYCYFEGLCKIVNVSQKAFVDDVVKGFEKLSEEWKAKLEEMELGCDAPDDDEDYSDHRDSKEFQKALSSSDRMKKLAKRSAEISTKFYKQRLGEMQADRNEKVMEDGDETKQRNLVKEIVLTRHAILEGEIGRKD